MKIKNELRVVIAGNVERKGLIYSQGLGSASNNGFHDNFFDTYAYRSKCLKSKTVSLP